jgi:hypothetical protein
MTAKLKHGHKHHPAHGADPGSTHERLLRRHAEPGRPEGAMHPGGAMAAPAPAMPQQPPMGAPPMGAPAGPSMGAGPSTGDDDEGGMS